VLLANVFFAPSKSEEDVPPSPPAVVPHPLSCCCFFSHTYTVPYDVSAIEGIWRDGGWANSFSDKQQKEYGKREEKQLDLSGADRPSPFWRLLSVFLESKQKLGRMDGC
jgi:hypothetical protein